MSVQPQLSDLTQADFDEIQASVQRWVELSIARDFDALGAELLTDDAIFFPPDAPICVGRAACVAYLHEYPEIEAFTASLTEVTGRGDTAIGHGVFDITAVIDGASVQAVGKFFAGYRKTTDGWRATHDAWNNDAPIG